ncbi:TIGR04282 family arsenosugar biosynthesis glycosyltransferase [Erythrobacter rubeus]|uniref:TIGR04282 family arsenosugar biosynthesis glycosyltransferase n=1 Tax=Erythrobacter rubeus TaxID=2760803 RepID=A0ABR8KPR6_9SPHN|nr:TIGR04282 family arsenosugar biosynthesis glycosyltransferase [Erythrobacter rubeus]MBD2842738.1 TIGR04282 family arsenosugar biosynthesis glycosyltransferase [Erythrobacter rubeus]
MFTRYPAPGCCKTRLIPAVGAEGAAAIHRQLAHQTFQVLAATDAPVTVAFTGAPAADFKEWLGGEARYEQQAEGGLTERLKPFVDRAPVIFFGSDTPDLQPSHVNAAIEGLATHRVVIGPAEDGGYYLIAMREPIHELVEDIPWSTDRVLPETLRKLSELEIEPLLLDTLADCDRPEDLKRWPDLGA